MSEGTFPLSDDARFRAIVEGQTELVCCYLPDTTVTYVNAAYCRFFNLKREDIVGRSFAFLVSPERRVGLLEHIHWQVVNKTPRNEIQREKALDGGDWIVEWTDQALCDADGNVLEIVAVGRDATDRVRAEEEHQQLEIARHALNAERAINTLRANLMHILTHELRTPLAIIQSSLDLLTRYAERLTSAQHEERIAQINLQIRMMTEMMDDIGLSLRMQMNELAINPAEIDLPTIVRNLVHEIGSTIGVHHEYVIQVDANTSCVVLDRLLLHRILTNLITNAVKYSPHGTSIEIGGQIVNGELILRVQDQGIGIPAADADHLYEPFFRGSNVGEVQGTGIGLSLVRECVQAHSGRIEMISKEGAGTTFTVYIPQPLVQA